MSLINDALKRAREAQRKDAPSGLSALPPVETHRSERDFNLFLPVMITFLVVTAFMLIGLALAKHTGKIEPKTLVAAPAVVPQVAKLPATVLPVTNPTVLPVVPVFTSLPVPKPLRVQGIAYDPVHPSAIIGGQAVSVGSLVNGLRVTSISPDSVTLVGNGRTNTLYVGQP